MPSLNRCVPRRLLVSTNFKKSSFAKMRWAVRSLFLGPQYLPGPNLPPMLVKYSRPGFARQKNGSHAQWQLDLAHPPARGSSRGSQPMKFVSLGSSAPPFSITEAIVNGIAPDGGLYVPSIWPQLKHSKLQKFQISNRSRLPCFSPFLKVIRWRPS